jgi:para-nitrobenzyl esterase
LPVYSYLFTHESPALGGLLGACHALELSFVFGTLDAPMQDRFAGQGPAVDALSRTMMDVWLSFSRNGVPESSGLPAPFVPYDLARRPTCIFDSSGCRMEDDPLGAERAAWDGIMR